MKNAEEHRRPGLTFIVVAAGVFISTLDSSMVNLALPAIMREFHASLGHTEWVVLAYLMTISSSLLFWGRIGDRISRAGLYGSGLLLFLAGAIAAFLAPNLSLLIAARLLQGSGAAIIMACGPALIRETTERERLGSRLGLIGVAVGLGLMCGPVVAGVIMDHLSWRYIFWASLLPGLFAALLSTGLPGSERAKSHPPMDLAGAALWGMVLLSLTLFLSTTANGADRFTVWASGGSFFLALALMTGQQKKSRRPFLPLAILSNPYFLLGIISAVISFLALFSAIFLIPFYLEHGRMISPSQTGMVMLAVPVAAIIAAPIAGRLADRFSGPPVASCGLAISTLGLALLATLASDTPLFAVWLRLFALGCGMAIFLAPNSSAVLGGLKKSEAGSGAALLATARNIGMLLGTSLAALTFSQIFHFLSGTDIRDFRAENLAEMVIAMRTTFTLAAVIATIGIFISMKRGSHKR